MDIFKLLTTFLLVIIIILLALYVNKCNKEHFNSTSSSQQTPPSLQTQPLLQTTSTICNKNIINSRTPYHNQNTLTYNKNKRKHPYNL